MNEPTIRGGQAGRGTETISGPRALITISRQHGARGAVVAKLVAERLGFACWDRELVGAIAAQLRVAPATVIRFDEHRRCSGDDTEPGRTATLSDPGHADYVRGLKLVARSLAKRGAAVVVGRGLAFVLDPAECLRVRVVCPLDDRIAGLVERANLAPETARATIDYVDRERQAFIRELYDRDIEDPAGYDLQVSTGAMSVDTAVDVIVAAYRSRFDARPWPKATTPAPFARREHRPTMPVSRNR